MTNCSLIISSLKRVLRLGIDCTEGQMVHSQENGFSPIIKGIFIKRLMIRRAWWCTSVLSALWRLRQEKCEFEPSLGNTVVSCLKKSF